MCAWLAEIFSGYFRSFRPVLCVSTRNDISSWVVCGESGIDGARIIFWPWPIGPRTFCTGEGGKLLSIYCFIIYVHGSRVIILYPPRAREICRIFYPTRTSPTPLDPTDSWRTDGRTSPFCSTIGMTTCFFFCLPRTELRRISAWIKLNYCPRALPPTPLSGRHCCLPQLRVKATSR